MTLISTLVRCTFLLVLVFIFDSSTTFARSTVGNLSRTGRSKSEAAKIAKMKQVEADTARMTARYVTRDPYVPQRYDYGIELGAMWRERNMFWVGMDAGFHLGTCVFSLSQRCQQYFDTILGIGGRDSYTHFLGLGSLRWQFMQFPSSWSPLVRVLAGVNASVEPTGSFQRFTYGAGIGITTFLHPRADLRVETRFLQSNIFETQVLVSMQLKIDKWIKYFADRIKDVGIGTVTIPIKAVETTVDVTGKVIGVSGEEKQKSKENKAPKK